VSSKPGVHDATTLRAMADGRIGASMIHVVACVGIPESSCHALGSLCRSKPSPPASTPSAVPLSLADPAAGDRRLEHLCLTLSLTELGPESSARCDPAPLALTDFSAPGDGTVRPREAVPAACKRPSQASPHPSSPERTPEVAIRCRGTWHTLRTRSSRRRGIRRVPRSRAGHPGRADAHDRPPSGWTRRSGCTPCGGSGCPRLGTRCLYLAWCGSGSLRTTCRGAEGSDRVTGGGEGGMTTPHESIS
jgi:hypothetical protein